MKSRLVRAIGAVVLAGGFVASAALPAAAWETGGTRYCSISQTPWASGTGTQYVTTFGPGKATGRTVYSSASHTVTEKGVSGGGAWRVIITGVAYSATSYCTSGS